MIIVGAKGFAKEVLEICVKLNLLDKLAFYDDISTDLPEMIFGSFGILRTLDDAKSYFYDVDNRYTIGIGNPHLRKIMWEKFNYIGGSIIPTISPDTHIGTYDVQIGLGANILDGVKISNSVYIGKLPLIYYNSIICHDSYIGDFVEISPNVTILGHVRIGDLTHVGANATILPNVSVGKNVTVGAGAVVTKDIPDNSIAVGVPAKVLKNKVLL